VTGVWKRDGFGYAVELNFKMSPTFKIRFRHFILSININISNAACFGTDVP